jgi:hypothetical protein
MKYQFAEGDRMQVLRFTRRTSRWPSGKPEWKDSGGHPLAKDLESMAEKLVIESLNDTYRMLRIAAADGTAKFTGIKESTLDQLIERSGRFVNVDVGARAKTVTTVNKVLAEMGVQERLVRGDGYFYFFGGNAEGWDRHSVSVYRIDSYSVQGWIRQWAELAFGNE